MLLALVTLFYTHLAAKLTDVILCVIDHLVVIKTLFTGITSIQWLFLYALIMIAINRQFWNVVPRALRMQ